jgi:hypothetical protein
MWLLFSKIYFIITIIKVLFDHLSFKTSSTEYGEL